MQTKIGCSLLYLSVLFFLTGCGQMGPLYLPHQKSSVPPFMQSVI
ncbi:LPS translocon maturation chaperone LptM [Rickettsiella grylli]|uniref:Conserved domain protein n=1 Tax=Rickettsiella grylli TaxID=59196 RepID=A8PN37_9COXI|nr:lipoprotein [Rickettsiella grylli]EDP46139.1 conserved domain protein [Rickettsiella grylli]